MSLKVSKSQFDAVGKKGRRRIVGVGTSKAVTIPSYLFKMFWDKEDNIELYIPNSYTIIIINNNAKDREIESLKNEVEVNERDIASYRE